MDKPKVSVLFPKAESPKVEIPPVQEVHSTGGVKPLFAKITQSPVIQGQPIVAVFPGMFVRKRPAIDLASLRATNNDVPENTLLSALEEIRYSDIDKLTVTVALEFGVPEQKEHGSISDRMLSLSTDPLLQSMTDRMRDMASEIRKVESTSKGLGKFLESLVDTDTQKERVVRIEKNAQTLEREIGSLPGLRNSVTLLSSDLAKTIHKVQVKLVVARWMSYTLSNKEVASIITNRVSSLLVSSISLLQAVQQISVIDQRMVHLTTVVQSSLMNLMPSWKLCRVASAQQKQQNLNVTEKLLQILDV